MTTDDRQQLVLGVKHLAKDVGWQNIESIRAQIRQLDDLAALIHDREKIIHPLMDKLIQPWRNQ